MNHEKPPIKHSPGPWKAEIFIDREFDDERWQVLADNGTQPYLIAVIENGQPGDTMETEGATARLMAAAPELLAALKESHSLWENLLYHLEEMGVAEAALQVKGTAINMETFAAMLGNTKAAIAKAEGKSE